MKLLLYADNHFSKQSSILRSRGEKYSKRLENQIQSLNWVERLAQKENCDAIVCLGDFFDKPILDAEEISALKEVNWGDTSRIFLVGNHELGLSTQDFNSAYLFSLIGNNTVVSEPYCFDVGDTSICLLPYILEDNRKPLKEYLQNATKEKILVLSHNDLMGVQYGGYESKLGFGLDEINDCCDLFINGHIHNGGWVNKKTLNLGNLTGQNFSESTSTTFGHSIAIIDTNNLSIEFVKNPYAIHFVKDENDISKIALDVGDKCSFVVSVTCNEDDIENLKCTLDSHKNILDYRIVVNRKKVEIKREKVETLNHLDRFVKFVHSTIGSSKDIDEELSLILS